jgi:hypothetical protein
MIFPNFILPLFDSSREGQYKSRLNLSGLKKEKRNNIKENTKKVWEKVIKNIFPISTELNQSGEEENVNGT